MGYLTLTYIGIIVFFVLIATSAVIGFLWGWKKTLYFGIANFIAMLGAWALGAALAAPLTPIFTDLINSFILDPQGGIVLDVSALANELAGLVVWFSSFSLLMSGFGIIAFFLKPILKNKAKDKKKWISRCLGLGIGVACSLPLISTFTELTFAATSTNNDSAKKKLSDDSAANAIHQFTSWMYFINPANFYLQDEKMFIDYSDDIYKINQTISNDETVTNLKTVLNETLTSISNFLASEFTTGNTFDAVFSYQSSGFFQTVCNLGGGFEKQTNRLPEDDLYGTEFEEFPLNINIQYTGDPHDPNELASPDKYITTFEFIIEPLKTEYVNGHLVVSEESYSEISSVFNDSTREYRKQIDNFYKGISVLSYTLNNSFSTDIISLKSTIVSTFIEILSSEVASIAPAPNENFFAFTPENMVNYLLDQSTIESTVNAILIEMAPDGATIPTLLISELSNNIKNEAIESCKKQFNGIYFNNIIFAMAFLTSPKIILMPEGGDPEKISPTNNTCYYDGYLFIDTEDKTTLDKFAIPEEYLMYDKKSPINTIGNILAQMFDFGDNWKYIEEVNGDSDLDLKQIFYDSITKLLFDPIGGL